MLPDNYPHKEKLEGAGYTKRQKVRSQLAADGGGQLKTILDEAAIEEIRQYESGNPEQPAATAPPQQSEATKATSAGDKVVAVVTEDAPVTTQTQDAGGEKKEPPTTEIINLGQARMFKGQIYGPGDVPVPVEFAESLRRQKVIE